MILLIILKTCKTVAMNKVLRFLFVVNHLTTMVVFLFDEVLNMVFPNIRKKYGYRLSPIFNFHTGLYGLVKEEVKIFEKQKYLWKQK